MHSIPSSTQLLPKQQKGEAGDYQRFWVKRIEQLGDCPTPFLLSDISIAGRQIHLFRSLLSRISLFYAIKANPSPMIISSIDHLIDGYDVASVAEIELLLGLGMDSSRISYNNPVKSRESITRAAELGVKRFVFQSREEAEKIAQCAIGAEVLVRVKMQDSKDAQSFSSKFGCPPEDAAQLLKYAKKIGLKPLGVTFHVGSQATELQAWRNAINKAQLIVTEVRKSGVDIRIINMGGGIPVQYSNDDPSLYELAKVINDAIDEGPSDIDYIAEPGRFLTADSSVIVTTVIGREDRDGVPWLYLDIGIFQAFMEVFEFGRFFYPVFSLRHAKNASGRAAQKSFVLTGPTCDSCDTMAKGVLLPSDIREGDKLVVCKSGAYTTVYGSNFNGFEIPRVKVVGVVDV